MEPTKVYYRGHLPHYQPPDATFFVTFRLAGSLPGHVVGRLRQEREKANRRFAGMNDERRKREDYHAYQKAYFERFDALLNGDATGPRWLDQSEIAQLVLDSVKYRDGKEYDLLACCVMPNHVYMLLTVGRNDIPTYKAKPLFRMLQSLKRHTAREANKLLKRSGAFWQDESYDHVVRDNQELERLFWYVLSNPVKAGLAESWEEWPWTWWKHETQKAL